MLTLLSKKNELITSQNQSVREIVCVYAAIHSLALSKAGRVLGGVHYMGPILKELILLLGKTAPGHRNNREQYKIINKCVLDSRTGILELQRSGMLTVHLHFPSLRTCVKSLVCAGSDLSAARKAESQFCPRQVSILGCVEEIVPWKADSAGWEQE